MLSQQSAGHCQSEGSHLTIKEADPGFPLNLGDGKRDRWLSDSEFTCRSSHSACLANREKDLQRPQIERQNLRFLTHENGRLISTTIRSPVIFKSTNPLLAVRSKL